MGHLCEVIRRDNDSFTFSFSKCFCCFAFELSLRQSIKNSRPGRGWWAQLKLLSGTKLALVIQSNWIVQPLLFSLFRSVELVMPMLFPRLLMEPGLNLLIAGRRVRPISKIGRKTESRRKAGVGGRSANALVTLLINFLISCLRPYRKMLDSSITRWKGEVLKEMAFQARWVMIRVVVLSRSHGYCAIVAPSTFGENPSSIDSLDLFLSSTSSFEVRSVSKWVVLGVVAVIAVVALVPEVPIGSVTIPYRKGLTP